MIPNMTPRDAAKLGVGVPGGGSVADRDDSRLIDYAPEYSEPCLEFPWE